MSTDRPSDPDAPYCGHCGYDLAGCTDSARCPECGRPLVDVLMRRRLEISQGRRYRSAALIRGWPAIDIAIGPSPDSTRGRARGILAIGDDARGVVAIGGTARGVVAVGGMSLGVFSLGGCSLGLVSAVGGWSMGGVASGGGAIGGIATAGGAVGIVATGGAAIGHVARGGGVFGNHTLGPTGRLDPIAAQTFADLSWLLGPPGISTWNWIQPFGIQLLVTILIGMAVVLYAFARDRDAVEPVVRG
jgi:hypothetical protein